MFSGFDMNQEGETLTDSSESRPWGKYTRFKYILGLNYIGIGKFSLLFVPFCANNFYFNNI